MFKRRGEASKVVVTLKPGTIVRVLKRKGRWIKVKVGKKRGWIPRTTVEALKRPSMEKVARKTRWGRRGGKPVAPPSELKVVVVRARVRLRSEPRDDATAVARVKRRDELWVDSNESARGWLHVRTRDGVTGWVQSDAVADKGASAIGTTRPPSDDAKAEVVVARTVTPVKRSSGRLRLSGAAELGVQSLDRDFSSNGASDVAVYQASSQVVSVGVSGDLRYRIGRRGLVGGDVSYRFGFSDGGLHFTSDTGLEAEVPFTTHEVDAGLRGGMIVSAGVRATARVGYRYAALMVAALENPGRLPHESLRGPTLGGRVVAEGLLGAVTLGVAADVMIAGTRSQTPGLEDGEMTDASALWLGASVSYRLSSGVDLGVHYGYARASTSWAGAAVPRTGATEADRTDTQHAMFIGLSRAL